MAVIALLDLGTRELHAPSRQHAVAVCGEHMPDAGWMAGNVVGLIDKADYICPLCFPGG